MEDSAIGTVVVRDGWLIWEVPGKPVSVRLSRDVVARLSMAVREGFKALPRRGLETGGLLIGTKKSDNGRVVIAVDDFEPVESEHAAGPSYLLSEADRRLLEARIAARSVGKAASVVGFYRSHTRRDFAITPEDDLVFSQYFRNSSNVFLLIKSNESAPPTAGFVIREAGRILSTSPYRQFPLDPSVIPPTAQDEPAAALPVSAHEISHELPRPAPIEETRPARPSSSPRPGPASRPNWPVWLAAGAVVLGVSLSLEIPKRHSGPLPPQPKASLGLAVTSSGGGLRLSWDHQVSSHFGNAVLWIHDGTDQQRIELDSHELSQGSVAYFPRTNDVNFRLDLLSSTERLSESVRAIGVQPSVAAVPGPPALASQPSPLPQQATTPPRSNPTGTASRQFSRAFVVPKSKPAPAAPPPLADPPTTRAAAVPPPDRSRDHLKAIVPGIESQPTPFRVSVEPVTASRMERLARNIPLLGRHYRHADYVPPTPLHDPGLDNLPRRNVIEDVNIDVKVFVDQAGKVDHSEVVSKVVKNDRDLAAIALLSARRWQFVPARTGEGVVPGEVILHYQFGPGAMGSQ